MYVSSRVDALTTGVSLWHPNTNAVNVVVSRPMMDNVTATIDCESLHLPNSNSISWHSVKYNVTFIIIIFLKVRKRKVGAETDQVHHKLYSDRTNYLLSGNQTSGSRA